MANANYSVQYDYEDEISKPRRKRESKRRWREIERYKEQRRLSREIAQNDIEYFDLLEDA